LSNLLACQDLDGNMKGRNWKICTVESHSVLCLKLFLNLDQEYLDVDEESSEDIEHLS
jgi:hypothetical protein